MKVNVQPPSLDDTVKVQADGSILLNVSGSNHFAPGELQFLFSFKIDGKKAAKDLGFDEASKKIPAYLTRALSNGGTFYIKGSFDRPEFHYVGDPAIQKIEICAKAKDSLGQESAEKCRTITFTTDPNLGGSTSFTVGGTVAGLIGTVVLQNNGGDNLTLNANGSFTFNTSLIENATYDVTVLSKPSNQNCTILNGSGTIAASNITNIIVTCSPKTWIHPSSLSDNISLDGTNASSPVVAMDNNGNAIIVWSQVDGPLYQIYKSEYRNGVWTHPSGFGDNISVFGTDVYAADVAMDDNDNAIIVWNQVDGGTSQIFKSEYRNGAWTHPSGFGDNISPDGTDAYFSQVAMDNNGNAIITWQQSDGANGQIFKSEYRNGVWTHPSNLADNISPNGTEVTIPQVVMDNDGNAIIVWCQSDGAVFQTFKSEYRNGAWTHPSNLADNISPNGTEAAAPQVAMDNNGNAIITWEQIDGANYQIFKSEYRSGSWTHPANLVDNISPNGSFAYSSQVAMDDNDNAVITWTQNEAGNFQIFKSEYRSGAWTHPANTADNISPGSFAYASQVAMDNNGSAIITWTQIDGGNYQTFKSEYRSGAWTHPANLADNISPDGTDGGSPSVAMDNNGDAIITWYQSDGVWNQIFISEYR